MAVLYCECGHKIWTELWWREPKDVLLFFDDAEGSETYGEQVIPNPAEEFLEDHAAWGHQW